MALLLKITPRDPIIARDGRPFGVGQGHRMKSLDWLYPSVLAGSLRTLLGKLSGGDFGKSVTDNLKQIEIAGPLPMVGNRVFFPAPSDLVVWEENQQDGSRRKLMPLRPIPLKDGEGCNLPQGLCPLAITEDVKPADVPTFWSESTMQQWLMSSDGNGIGVPPSPAEASPENGYLDAPQRDERIHVSINPNTGATDEGMLFMTVGLDMTSRQFLEPVSLTARIDSPGKFLELAEKLDTQHPLGGERRLAEWKAIDTQSWSPKTEVINIIGAARGLVRMILATPAIFKNGWKPDWLGEDLVGYPPGTDVRLKLVAACVGRWRPISGWCLEKGRVGPKPVKRMAPAGSVYFFEVDSSGDTAKLVKNLWLRSVCDDEQDRRDGFGLAVWGVWNYGK